jgi:hypothetical protein
MDNIYKVVFSDGYVDYIMAESIEDVIYIVTSETDYKGNKKKIIKIKEILFGYCGNKFQKILKKP